jgi:hypothetical protein
MSYVWKCSRCSSIENVRLIETRTIRLTGTLHEATPKEMTFVVGAPEGEIEQWIECPGCGCRWPAPEDVTIWTTPKGEEKCDPGTKWIAPALRKHLPAGLADLFPGDWHARGVSGTVKVTRDDEKVVYYYRGVPIVYDETCVWPWRAKGVNEPTSVKGHDTDIAVTTLKSLKGILDDLLTKKGIEHWDEKEESSDG